jgi:hypothetical protein
VSLFLYNCSSLNWMSAVQRSGGSERILLAPEEVGTVGEVRQGRERARKTDLNSEDSD